MRLAATANVFGAENPRVSVDTARAARKSGRRADVVRTCAVDLTARFLDRAAGARVCPHSIAVGGDDARGSQRAVLRPARKLACPSEGADTFRVQRARNLIVPRGYRGCCFDSVGWTSPRAHPIRNIVEHLLKSHAVFPSRRLFAGAEQKWQSTRRSQVVPHEPRRPWVPYHGLTWGNRS